MCPRGDGMAVDSVRCVLRCCNFWNVVGRECMLQLRSHSIRQTIGWCKKETGALGFGHVLSERTREFNFHGVTILCCGLCRCLKNVVSTCGNLLITSCA